MNGTYMFKYYIELKIWKVIVKAFTINPRVKSSNLKNADCLYIFVLLIFFVTLHANPSKHFKFRSYFVHIRCMLRGGMGEDWVWIFYSLIISFWTLQSCGWCHSLLEFKTVLSLLLMYTPSLTCLERQSLNTPVVLALNWACLPWCFSSWCFLMKESWHLFLLLYFPRCSFALVYKFRLLSPMYTHLSVSGHNSHSISYWTLVVHHLLLIVTWNTR